MTCSCITTAPEAEDRVVFVTQRSCNHGWKAVLGAAVFLSAGSLNRQQLISFLSFVAVELTAAMSCKRPGTLCCCDPCLLHFSSHVLAVADVCVNYMLQNVTNSLVQCCASACRCDQAQQSLTFRQFALAAWQAIG
jgi:hypothetical protein